MMNFTRDEIPPEDAGGPLGQTDCPVPLTHDRFEECHWQFHEMLRNYHHPATFRFSTNAFLHALKSVLDMLRIDLERAGHNEWRKDQVDALKSDPLFAAFSRGRDVVVHRGSLIQSSHVEVGLFKYNRMKFAIERDIKTDEPSHSLLSRIVRANSQSGLFVDEAHTFEFEQLGVRRMYFEPKLSTDHDVVTAANLAFHRVGIVLTGAHALMGFSYGANDMDVGKHAHSVEQVNLFQETDADPDAIERWGWLNNNDED